MLSKNKIKYIHSLELKKNRIAERAFVAEGNKLVADMLPFFSCKLLVAKPFWMATQGDISAEELLVAEEEDIRKASFQKNPQDVLAVFAMPDWQIETASPQQDLVLALDGIQDPGNLGTIIRTCDWFGVHDIVCSKDTADCYNPKVVQATMGALCRVRIHYVDLKEWLAAQECPIIGTLLEGGNMYESPLPKTGIIVMGNEGNGISQEVRKLITHPVRIPSYPKEKASDVIESLNVAIATAIVLAEFRR